MRLSPRSIKDQTLPHTLLHPPTHTYTHHHLYFLLTHHHTITYTHIHTHMCMYVSLSVPALLSCRVTSYFIYQHTACITFFFIYSK